MLGYIHSFESLAAVDGSGVRYGVFFAGCPLRCAYCHNPDTWNCGGTEYDAEQLVKKIIRYKPYFKNNGGVTFSGGEPLLQADFLCEVIPHLINNDISYVVDTSGAVELSEKVKYVLENSDCILLDLKFPDNEMYEKYTGVGIENTLKTLNYLESIGKNTWIRTVIVPNLNDTEKELDRYLGIIKQYKCVKKYELLPFHTLGFFKYENLGITNPLENTPPLDSAVKDRLQDYVKKHL